MTYVIIDSSLEEKYGYTKIIEPQLYVRRALKKVLNYIIWNLVPTDILLIIIVIVLILLAIIIHHYNNQFYRGTEL